MKFKLILINILVFAVIAISCNSNESGTQSAVTKSDSTIAKTIAIKEEPVTYTIDGKNYKGYITYDSSQQGKRPAILVVHEWWGLTNYPRSRAKKLAELGYIAMAVDMFGNGDTATDPKQAQEMTAPYYKDPTLAKKRLEAAISVLKGYAQTDSTKMAAIGYCYGGFIVLNAAKLGADLQGVVTFHGDLSGVAANKSLLKAKILVCHGAADKFVTPQAVDAFKKSMDSAGVDYTFKAYPNATHAFTNPDATELGKKFSIPIEYNAAADSASWNDMKDFFKKIF